MLTLLRVLPMAMFGAAERDLAANGSQVTLRFGRSLEAAEYVDQEVGLQPSEVWAQSSNLLKRNDGPSAQTLL